MHYQGKPGVDGALTSGANNRRTYSVAEVADMYGVHPATIYREIKAGRLKAMRLGAKGGVVRVPATAVEEYEATAVAS
jgi:excisionase family DNA binding protein